MRTVLPTSAPALKKPLCSAKSHCLSARLPPQHAAAVTLTWGASSAPRRRHTRNPRSSGLKRLSVRLYFGGGGGGYKVQGSISIPKPRAVIGSICMGARTNGTSSRHQTRARSDVHTLQEDPPPPGMPVPCPSAYLSFPGAGRCFLTCLMVSRAVTKQHRNKSGKPTQAHRSRPSPNTSATVSLRRA